MKSLTTFLFCLFLYVFTVAQTLPSGFSNSQNSTAISGKEQLALEQEFRSYLSGKEQEEWMKFMTSKPHHVGTAHGKAVAEFIAEKFKSWGYETRIETYDVLFPTPKKRVLELVSPVKYKAGLMETPVKGDPFSAQVKEALPPYNAYSIDGNVTAELVFVNYGIPQDYERLADMGIDVKGKIVIAKYAGSWRGIKPKLAAEKGAIGCIIYSDPEDDGYGRGVVYPDGPFKPETGVQRGSVYDLPTRAGDPLTPFEPSKPGVKRLELSESETLTRIPVLPISYKDALPLLRSLSGTTVPSEWRGSLPITYSTGPGPAVVHLELAFDWSLKPAYNVIAMLKGSQYPDEWVMRGNHHDAWVHGAADPVSGMVALMDEAKAVGQLAKNGKRPLRTIVYCAWDAEEPGIIGSTEWVEDHRDELSKKVVTYINTDGNGRGYFSAGGSHALERLVNEVAAVVEDPQKKVSILERKWAWEVYSSGKMQPKYMELGALGSGSDYSPFFQHLGIPSLNIGFGGENAGGEYHTMYDTYEHFRRFKDPGLVYGQTLAETAGRITLRIANAGRHPFYFSDFVRTLSGYADQVEKLAETLRTSSEENNKIVGAGVYQLVRDPLGQNLTYQKEYSDPVPFLNFSELQNAIKRLEHIADLLDESNEVIDDRLFMAERLLIDETGLPRRPWYRHVIYAPGYYTGYGVKTLPGIREALEQGNWAEAQSEINEVAKRLNNLSDFLERK